MSRDSGIGLVCKAIDSESNTSCSSHSGACGSSSGSGSGIGTGIGVTADGNGWGCERRRRPQAEQQGRRGSRQRRVTSPASLAVLASWLDSPSHLAAAPDGTDASGHRLLYDQEVLSRFQTVSRLVNLADAPHSPTQGGLQRTAVDVNPHGIPSPSNGLWPGSPSGGGENRNTTATTTTTQRQQTTGLQRQRRRTPDGSTDPLNHPGVERLLTEYYRMVKASRSESAATSTKQKRAGQELLLRWCCPQPPEYLQLYSVAKASAVLLGLLATCAVYLIPVLVPTWLYVLRHLLVGKNSSWAMVILAAALGVLLFYLAEALHTERKRKRQEKAGRLCAFKIGADGQLPPEAAEFLSAVTSSQGLGTQASKQRERNDPKGHQQFSGRHPDASQPSWQQPTVGPALQELLNDIRSVRTAVLGVQGGAKMENGSDEAEMRNQVKMLCEAVGVPYSANALASIRGMRAKLEDVRRIVGC